MLRKLDHFFVKKSSLFVVMVIPYIFLIQFFCKQGLQNLWTGVAFHHLLRWWKENIFQLWLGDSELNKMMCVFKDTINNFFFLLSNVSFITRYTITSFNCHLKVFLNTTMHNSKLALFSEWNIVSNPVNIYKFHRFLHITIHQLFQTNCWKKHTLRTFNFLVPKQKNVNCSKFQALRDNNMTIIIVIYKDQRFLALLMYQSSATP